MMKRYMTQWHHHHYTNIEIVFNEQYVDWDSAIRNKKVVSFRPLIWNPKVRTR